jgi:hypothetical protein
MEDPSISRPSVDVIDTDGIQHPRTTSGIEIMIHSSVFESRYITDGDILHKGNVCFLNISALFAEKRCSKFLRNFSVNLQERAATKIKIISTSCVKI